MSTISPSSQVTAAMKSATTGMTAPEPSGKRSRQLAAGPRDVVIQAGQEVRRLADLGDRLVGLLASPEQPVRFVHGASPPLIPCVEPSGSVCTRLHHSRPAARSLR